MIENNFVPQAIYLEGKRQRLLIRGTPEWDKREHAREAAGCRCLSFGPIIGDGKLATLKVDALAGSA